MLTNVHKGLAIPLTCRPHTLLCDGEYEYYHYICDGYDDRGWGCGYRTLQTICSWMQKQRPNIACNASVVPSIRDIQKILASIGDKPAHFVGSKDWIGCVEAALVVDKIYDVPCKIVHIRSGDLLPTATSMLRDHFGQGALNGGSPPVMMGGDTDASSKGILGVCSDASRSRNFVLVLDPHFVEARHGSEGISTSLLQRDGWVAWQPLDSFVPESFYNICLPQVGNG